MEREFHFRDNLFFISLHVKALQSTLRLQIDNEFICEKTASDIEFIHRVLEKFYLVLTERKNLVDRLECIQLLRATIHSYLEYLSHSIQDRPERTLLNGHASHEKLKEIHDTQTAYLTALTDIVHDSGVLDEENRNTVSQTELEMLLHSSE